jgi:hypothetical protein
LTDGEKKDAVPSQRLTECIYTLLCMFVLEGIRVLNCTDTPESSTWARVGLLDDHTGMKYLVGRLR